MNDGLYITKVVLCSSSKLDDPAKERDSTSQDSGIQSSLPDVRSDSPLNQHRTTTAYKPSNYSTPTTSSSQSYTHNNNTVRTVSYIKYTAKNSATWFFAVLYDCLLFTLFCDYLDHHQNLAWLTGATSECSSYHLFFQYNK